LLDISLDWNYITFWQPLYTPLWSTAHQFCGALVNNWIIFPILYFKNAMGALTYAPMSSGTWDESGNPYNISLITTAANTLNQTAMDNYSLPRWSPSYAMYFFWGFAGTAAALVYAILWYGKEAWTILRDSWRNKLDDYDDPYLKVMTEHPRVPHWWYFALIAICGAFSFAQIYEGQMTMPWW
jgi:hypothetical protein